MARFQGLGYFEDVDPDKGVVLSGETFTCAHCNRLVELKHKEVPAMCHAEWRPVCQKCHAVGTCKPFEKRLETFEQRMAVAMRRQEFLRSVGIEET